MFRSRNHKLRLCWLGPFLGRCSEGLVIFVHLIHYLKMTAGYPSLEPLALVPEKNVSFLRWPFALPGLAPLWPLWRGQVGFGETDLMSLDLQASMDLVTSSLWCRWDPGRPWANLVSGELPPLPTLTLGRHILDLGTLTESLQLSSGSRM